MPREAGTFSCPEHAIAVAYLMLAMPIEPKNPTQLVCEALRERFDVEYERKALSGLTPHEWHAQAVFIVKLMERTLGDSVGFHILRAQYGTGEEGAASARRISEWLNPEGLADSCERELTDLLVTNILRGRPRLRDLSDRFDLPYSAIQRAGGAYRVLVEGKRRAALHRLDTQMREACIVCAEFPIDIQTEAGSSVYLTV
ncbi:hypothetical protein [Achromobacter xylosoxidans]|uniref:hypothetical protein n=1 Tax=Alcaligenes xylosoxydans xylosoxydans TaxID=85698 RepID=UPI0006BF1F85|nr:hypothetical protein [Achromobacter xylosoxidans]MCH4571904.1 hypothetical protein [Achromobacter xylosoxidans]MDD7988142.1 hypothetical protein [Achromobacter xylosoxidans]NEV03812.1 hypothetical protein [Achromobacter xylosoxidans]OFO60982.1 hypothetical protein HMPREF3024_24550 [Achromobacter xylosoxidans]OMG81369.1 hypothetical protein BIZ53_29260 [Achromobacter xylosoxidans]